MSPTRRGEWQCTTRGPPVLIPAPSSPRFLASSSSSGLVWDGMVVLMLGNLLCGGVSHLPGIVRGQGSACMASESYHASVSNPTGPLVTAGVHPTTGCHGSVAGSNPALASQPCSECTTRCHMETGRRIESTWREAKNVAIQIKDVGLTSWEQTDRQDAKELLQD